MEFDVKEYNSVVLGALLHDVGKFTEKQIEVKKKGLKHPYYSECFISEHIDGLLKDKGWVDLKKVKLFAKRHHEYKSAWEAEYLIQEISDDHNRMLAYIVGHADSASSRERSDRRFDELFLKREARRFPLDSIFAEISLREKDFYEKDCYYYHDNISVISPETAFPLKKDGRKDKPLLKLDEYKTHYANFIREVDSIKPEDSFEKFYISLLSLLEKYCWCVPSATNEKLSDISLYDHLKTTSAIAACLYQYHHLEKKFDENSIKKAGSYKLLLLGGDLAGIQNYIYQLKGTTKLAKRLRARSFYITILVEAIIHWLLEKFSLPVSCCLTNGGGKFLLLLPDTEYVKKKLVDVSKEITEKLYKKFFGEVTLNLTWQEEKEEEIKDNLLTEYGFKIYDFFKHAEKTQDQLEIEKYRKFKRFLCPSSKWDTESFYIDKEIWEKYGERKKVCQICGKFPAEFSETKGESRIEVCDKCKLDGDIGKILPHTGLISFGKSEINCDETVNFNIFDDRFVTLWKSNEWRKWNGHFYMVKILPSGIKADGQLLAGSSHAFLANHIPIFKDQTELISFQKEYGTWLDKEDKEVNIKDPYSFTALAALAMDTDRKKGSPLIGVLKADIDRLGLIFGRGFKGIGVKKKRRIEIDGRIVQLDRVTPSRYLTMSRMIELFLSGWIHHRLSTNSHNLPVQKDYRKIYTVYSGGDDLLLVGPWETIIYFARELYNKFREFTCNNEDITLSAGIAVVKPKIPVNEWARFVNGLLERSKKDRDRLTLFDTTIKWEELNGLIDFMELLDKNMGRTGEGAKKERKPLVTMGFLYRLLRYNQLYRKAIEEKDVKSLIYYSQLSYDIRRNIIGKHLEGMEKGRRDKAIDEFMEHNNLYRKLIQLLGFQDGIENRLMGNLRIPVIWTIYKNRGGD
ncbi:hypothetical protein BMS3Bbin06_01171 [bacterium BMS3Bbin06]|nr:hypothetical protein BMS3Bbin06_01171 [bacterium BMS3Bbin06]HDL16185.1 type III-A CRISPR-associated protein Cas10/Csm1 [Euryarchaeota archaeon]